MKPLIVHYRGGSLDGRQRHVTNDDQVPVRIAIAKPESPGVWEHYAATNKKIAEDEGDWTLVEITYVFTHED